MNFKLLLMMDYNHHNKQKTRLAKNLDKTTCDYTNCLFT